MIFSVLGFMAKNEGVEVKDVAKSGYKNTCQQLLLAMHATEPLSKKSGNVLYILKTFIILLLSIMTFKVIFCLTQQTETFEIVGCLFPRSYIAMKGFVVV